MMAGPLIDLLVNSGMMGEVGKWGLEFCCREWKKWRRAGGGGRLSFNLSPQELRNPSLVSAIVSALRSAKLKSREIEFEVSEDTILSDRARNIRTLNQLRELGHRISLDDFGTGSSSLTTLQELPIDTLKLDRAMIHKLGCSERARGLVAGVLRMAQGLGLEVVAEGVETQAQRRWLGSLGCDLVQGYLLSAPTANLLDLLSGPSSGLALTS